MRRFRAVAFDLDGTLVTGTSTGRYVARKFGQGDRMDRLEAAFAAGTITNRAVADEDGLTYAGRSLAQVREALDGIPVVAGIPETLAVLRQAGVELWLATVTWSFIGDVFRDRYGFAASSGVVMGLDSQGRLTGRVEQPFDEQDKARWVLDQCRRAGLEPGACAAVGDARSDLPLFRAVGLSIAFNGSPEARRSATQVVDGDSLAAVLPCLLGTRPA